MGARASAFGAPEAGGLGRSFVHVATVRPGARIGGHTRQMEKAGEHFHLDRVRRGALPIDGRHPDWDGVDTGRPA